MQELIVPSSVSSNRRLGQVVSAFLICLTASGVIFGFAALKPVLIAEGIYSDLCLEPSLPGSICKEQDLALNLIFVLGTVATNVAALPVGMTLDAIGPRRLSLIGTAVLFTGLLFFGLGIRKPFFDTYLIGYALIGLGGPMVYLPSLHLSNCFPDRSGLVLSALTGAFDASSIIFVIYDVLYQHFRISPRTWFWCYTIIPVLICVEQLLYAPTAVYSSQAVTLDAASESTSLLRGPSQQDLHRSEYGTDAGGALHATAVHRDPIDGKLAGKTAGQQIKTTWFWAITLMFSVQMIRLNYYISTVWLQSLLFTGDIEKTKFIVTFFEVALPLGGALSIPLIGWLLDTYAISVTFAILAISGAVMSVLLVMPQVWQIVLGIMVFVVFRPLMYTAISDYVQKTMGMQTFGTVYGLSNTVAGFASLIQYPIDLWVNKSLNGNYLPVNYLLGIAGFIASTTVWTRIYTGTRSKTGIDVEES